MSQRISRFRRPLQRASRTLKDLPRCASTSATALLTAPVVLLAACTGQSPEAPSTPPSSPAQVTTSSVVAPDPTDLSTFQSTPAPAPAPTTLTSPPPPPAPPPPAPPEPAFTRTPQVLYLNYGGPEIFNSKGDNAATNESWVVGDSRGFGSDVYDFEPYPEESRDIVTSKVTELLSPYNVLVTTERPTQGDYEMAVISPSAPNKADGQSPLDEGNQDPNNIVFVMRTELPYVNKDLLGNGVFGPRKVGVEVVHEFFHSIGLDHDENPSIMHTESNTETLSAEQDAYVAEVLGRRG